MLRKLIKHEFRATGRVMLPMYLVLLATAVGANLSTRGILESPYRLLDILGALLVIAFAFALVGVCLMAFVLMIQRFYKNLLQDEGYISLTLPVSIHQHIWAKLTVAAVWFLATILAVILASMIVAYDVGIIREFGRFLANIWEGFRKLHAMEAVNFTGYILEGAVALFLGLAAFSLQFYAGLAAGHSFPNHKFLWSVVCFFAFQFLLQFLGGTLLVTLDSVNFFHIPPLQHWNPSLEASIHLGMLLLIAANILYGAIFYVVTVLFLKRRLNLE